MNAMENQDRRSDILGRLASIIKSEVNQPDIAISESTTARDVPGWDSLAHINIILAVEKCFGIKLKTAEVSEVQDVSDLIEKILQKGRH